MWLNARIVYWRHRFPEFGPVQQSKTKKNLNVILLRSLFHSYEGQKVHYIDVCSIYFHSIPFTTSYLGQDLSSFFFLVLLLFWIVLHKKIHSSLDWQKKNDFFFPLWKAKISFSWGVNKPILQNELNNDHLIIICCVLIHF